MAELVGLHQGRAPAPATLQQGQAVLLPRQQVDPWDGLSLLVRCARSGQPSELALLVLVRLHSKRFHCLLLQAQDLVLFSSSPRLFAELCAKLQVGPAEESAGRLGLFPKVTAAGVGEWVGRLLTAHREPEVSWRLLAELQDEKEGTLLSPVGTPLPAFREHVRALVAAELQFLGACELGLFFFGFYEP